MPGRSAWVARPTQRTRSPWTGRPGQLERGSLRAVPDDDEPPPSRQVRPGRRSGRRSPSSAPAARRPAGDSAGPPSRTAGPKRTEVDAVADEAGRAPTARSDAATSRLQATTTAAPAARLGQFDGADLAHVEGVGAEAVRHAESAAVGRGDGGGLVGEVAVHAGDRPVGQRGRRPRRPAPRRRRRQESRRRAVRRHRAGTGRRRPALVANTPASRPASRQRQQLVEHERLRHVVASPTPRRRRGVGVQRCSTAWPVQAVAGVEDVAGVGDDEIAVEGVVVGDEDDPVGGGDLVGVERDPPGGDDVIDVLDDVGSATATSAPRARAGLDDRRSPATRGRRRSCACRRDRGPARGPRPGRRRDRPGRARGG